MNKLLNYKVFVSSVKRNNDLRLHDVIKKTLPKLNTPGDYIYKAPATNDFFHWGSYRIRFAARARALGGSCWWPR